MDTNVIVSFLQLFAGCVLLAATGMAGWALKEVFRLRADVEALKAQSGNMAGWMKSISDKLDRVIEKS